MSRIIEDWIWAVLTIWMEARNQSYEGMRAVAEVIRNRMRLRYLSDGTVVGTVLRKHQFSCWNSDDPQRIRAAQIDSENPSLRACRDAWSASADVDRLLPLDTVNYLNPKTVLNQYGKLPTWATDSKKVAVVGDHHFFIA